MKKREQGILTVEASIVLTLMLLFILFLFSFGRVYRAQNLVSHATLQSADAVALESYLRETALQSDVSEVVNLASHITESSAISAESLESLRSANLPKIARQKFIAAIASSEAKADEKLKSMGVKNGLAGVDFSECKMDLANDDVIIAIRYTIEMQFPVFGFNEITVTKAAKAKTFGEILFEVSTEPNQPGWGSTSGDDKVVHGSTVQITATPNYGYKFVSWNDGNTDNPRTVTVTDAQHYIAIFEKDSFGINLSTRITYNTSYAGISHSSYGSVAGAGNYLYLENATISATPATNYQFVGWDDNGDGTVDNSNATRTITVDKTYDIKAIFKPAMKTVSVKANNGTYGAVQVSQGSNKGSSIQVEYGSKVQLLASSKDAVKYSFSKWSNNDTNASTTITVKDDAAYEAIFNVNTYTVTFYNGSTKLHTTTVIRGCSIDASKSTLGSSMYTGAINKFSRWVQSDGTTFNSSTKVNSNIKVSAKLKYTVTLAKGNSSATVDWTSKTKEVGEKVTLPTPVLKNHTFNGWYDSSENKYNGGSQPSFSSDVTLTAKWSCNHSVGKKIETYAPYCSDIYKDGKLKSGASLPYIKYECKTCGDTWKETNESLRKHRRMNYKDGSEGDDFWLNCKTKHPDDHWGYCGSWNGSGKNGKYHTWEGHYHILCNYCQKEEQGYVWCYVDGNLVYYNLHKCAKHGSKGTVNCPF